MLLKSVVEVVQFIVGAVWFINPPRNDGFVALSIWNGYDPSDKFGFKGGFPAIYIEGTGGEHLGEEPPSSQKLTSNQQLTLDIPLIKRKEIKMVRLQMHNSDAICASMITWKPSSNVPNANRRSGIVVGDLFYFCGRAWHYSGQTLSTKGRTANLRCGWMDADNTAPGSTKYLNINTDVMSTANLKHFDAVKNDICHWGFGTATAYSASSRVKRASQHMATFGDQVQVSKDLSAVELCDSETSWGPSFYSIKEKILCDMSTKTKIPLCEGGNTVGCFNYVSPRSARNNRGPHRGNHNERRGSIQTPTGTRTFNVTYFTTSDLNGTIVDDGDGY